MAQTWLRQNYSDLAADRILDAAAAMFVEHGVSAVDMADVARAAGCSRGTLYRYFENRDALRYAFAHREAQRLVKEASEAVEDITDPGERLVAVITHLVAEVRRTPHLAAWFAATDAGISAAMVNSSEVIESIAVSFFPVDPSDPPAEGVLQLARWSTRVALSLLMTPGRDPDEERSLLEQFLAPAATALWPVEA